MTSSAAPPTPVTLGLPARRVRTVATPTRYDHSPEQLAQLLVGQPPFRTRQVWQGLYEQLRHPAELTVLPKALRSELADHEQLHSALTTAVESSGDGGDTVKWLWNLGDGEQIETVLMHYSGRSTVCISTQAGCAMGCGFCATGQGGFRRHLSVGEIVEQVVAARRRSESTGRRLSNVVFMGMGEPMANYDAMWTSVTRFHSHLGLSARHITISTVGLVPGIKRLAGEDLPVNLAVSLHAANDELRNQIVPINRTYPLEALIQACQDYLKAKGRRLSFEWALIDGVNDQPRDAFELADLARPLGAHVNLIPLNPTPGYPTVGTPSNIVHAFCDRLVELGVNATIRRNRGTSIDAACGQLAARISADP